MYYLCSDIKVSSLGIACTNVEYYMHSEFHPERFKILFGGGGGGGGGGGAQPYILSLYKAKMIFSSNEWE